MFTYLAAQLRTGDIAVKGSEAYANWAAKLLSWEHCEPLLGAFCAESGLPVTAEAFVEAVRSRLAAKALEVDAGYPANTDLTIDQQTGRPTLKRRRGNDRTRSAIVLEERVKQRMPERTVLEMLDPTREHPRSERGSQPSQVGRPASWLTLFAVAQASADEFSATSRGWSRSRWR